MKPAKTEWGYAVGNGVTGTPWHIIDGQRVSDTESSWNVVGWHAKLFSMKLIS